MVALLRTPSWMVEASLARLQVEEEENQRRQSLVGLESLLTAREWVEVELPLLFRKEQLQVPVV